MEQNLSNVTVKLVLILKNAFSDFSGAQLQMFWRNISQILPPKPFKQELF